MKTLGNEKTNVPDRGVLRKSAGAIKQTSTFTHDGIASRGYFRSTDKLYHPGFLCESAWHFCIPNASSFFVFVFCLSTIIKSFIPVWLCHCLILLPTESVTEGKAMKRIARVRSLSGKESMNVNSYLLVKWKLENLKQVVIPKRNPDVERVRANCSIIGVFIMTLGKLFHKWEKSDLFC